MASKIAETPILYGRDAQVFLDATKPENVQPLPRQVVERMEKNYELFMAALQRGNTKF